MSSGINDTANARATSSVLSCCLAAMGSHPPCNRAWPINDAGRMTFLKIPQTVDLGQQQVQKGLYGGASSIANLPPELQCAILAQLPTVDRVCLALTCKSLTASAVSSSYLRTPPWTPWLFYTDDYFPSRNLLIQRLAHGWTDKSRLRYCQKCERILPRDKDYFCQRLPKKRKSLPYDVKVCMEKEQWKRLSSKKKYDHILKTWSESGREDSSVFSCNKCFTQEYKLANGFDQDLEKGTAGDRRGGSPVLQVPVECPGCVVDSLTNTYKEPRKPKVRPFLWKWTKRILSFAGNTVLVLIYLLYLLLKAPIDVGMWLFKKYRGSNFRLRRTLCRA